MPPRGCHGSAALGRPVLGPRERAQRTGLPPKAAADQWHPNSAPSYWGAVIGDWNMVDCCHKSARVDAAAPCSRGGSRATCSPPAGAAEPFAHFTHMIDHCVDFARQAKTQGRPVVGILCEFTPRELIMAAGGVPVCLCGGSAKTIPAAEQHLPANLCPLIKSTYGYHVPASNPFLEMADLVVGETTCDGKKKMYELMAETRPMYVLELPQKADDADALEHWRRELGKFRRSLERRFATSTSPTTDLREAIARDEPRAALRRRVGAADAGGPSAADRPATARVQEQHLGDPGRSGAVRAGLGPVARRPPACEQSSSAVRVLMTGVPMVHGAERVLDIIEHSGGLVVCMENCTGLKPILEDVDADGRRPAAGPWPRSTSTCPAR